MAKILSAVLSSAPPCTLADLQNPLDPGSDSPGPSPQRQSCATCRSSIIAILKLATSLSLLGGSRCFTQELKHFYTAQGVECSSATCHSWLSLASLEAQFPDDFLSSGVATAGLALFAAQVKASQSRGRDRNYEGERTRCDQEEHMGKRKHEDEVQKMEYELLKGVEGLEGFEKQKNMDEHKKGEESQVQREEPPQDVREDAIEEESDSDETEDESQDKDNIATQKLFLQGVNPTFWLSALRHSSFAGFESYTSRWMQSSRRKELV